MTHALSYSTCGLVIVRQNEIHDKLFYLYQHAFATSSVCAKLLIHHGRARSEQEIYQVSDKNKEKLGEAMVRSLCDRQVDAIIDARSCDADADSYKYEKMSALLARWETIKKDKNGKHYHDQQKHFSSFVLSVGGMLGREALAVCRN